ncbi:MAG: Sugar fermentation stimulation protein A [Promethearchaeota archaeon]|nr:MAG: Sugar fermentation stimulation protein A [Candidatus Lokiarchaeota archaeon]
MKTLLFKLKDLKKGRFKKRHNRFAGELIYQGKVDSVHIHDPGRLQELLLEDAEVLFTESRGKLTYYLKAIKKEGEWILLDSALHSKIAEQVLKVMPEFSHVSEIRREVPLGKSRIDFVLDETPLEVKGVSLVKDGLALFPDAPTKRGRRHVKEIIDHDGVLMFLILRKAEKFAPNAETDPKFAQELSRARRTGISIIPVQIEFDGEGIYYGGKIKLAEF